MTQIKTITILASLLFFWQGAWALHFIPNLGVEDGTEDYPFLINSVEDLQYLAEDVNNGITYEGLYFKLTKDDLNFSGKSFTPIGYGEEGAGKSFKGIFDGDGKTIYNIQYVNNEGVGVGLFGFIHSPAIIKNVTLDHCSFTGNNSVGAIVGNSAGSGGSEWGVFNCTVGADVDVRATTATIGEEESPGSYAGGIIGFNNCLTVSNCYSEATVTGNKFVGSIAGYMLGSAGHEAIIQECYFTGEGKAVGGRGKEDGLVDDATEGIINIILYDDDNEGHTIMNAARLANYNGDKVNVILNGRTLYKDNKWNTLCLPFAINDLTGTPLEGATVKGLSTSSFGDGTLEMNFESLTGPVAGKPCLIKWASGANISNPVFQNVLINNTINDAQTDYVDFKGRFTNEYLDAYNMGVLYLGSDNKLYIPSKDITIRAFRGYFQLKGITTGDPTEDSQARAMSFVMNFGEGKITSINEGLRMENEESAGAWYDLQGRKYNDKPKQKGVYINNRRSIVIK